MANTPQGIKKAKQTILEKYGKDYYANIGRKGGMNSKGTGFAYTGVGSDGLTGYQRAAKFGSIGGAKSKPYTKQPRPGNWKKA